MDTTSTEMYCDLGVFGEQLIHIHYDYQPYERATREYPGCEEGIDITQFMWDGVDYLNKLPPDVLEDIASDILENIYEDDGV